MERRIVLLGPPGSGKGTQAKRMAAEVGVPHVNVGQMFRQAVQSGTEVGQKAKAYLDGGALVPDEVVIQVVEDTLAKLPSHPGWVLDGYPRTMAQAEALEAFLKKRGEALSRVIYLKISMASLLMRLTNRRGCGTCGAVYHLKFQPPHVSGQCDRCGGKLKPRPDDAPEIVERRFDVYQAETAPVVDFYRQRQHLEEIEGDATPDAVAEQIRKAAAPA